MDLLERTEKCPPAVEEEEQLRFFYGTFALKVDVTR